MFCLFESGRFTQVLLLSKKQNTSLHNRLIKKLVFKLKYGYFELSRHVRRKIILKKV